MENYIEVNCIGFFEQIIDDSIAVFELELLEKHELDNNDNEKENIFNIFVNLKENENELIERYYYKCIISNEEKNGYIITKTNNFELFEKVARLFRNGSENENLWISFELDLSITEKSIKEINEVFSKFKRIEEFSYFLIHNNESEKDSMNKEWAKKLQMNKEKLNIFIKNPDRIEVIKILKELVPFFKAKPWDLPEKGEESETIENPTKDLVGELADILRNIQEIIRLTESELYEDKNTKNMFELITERNSLQIKECLARLISLPSLGISSMSTILHCLWSDYFLLYNKDVSLYLNKLGYNIKDIHDIGNRAEGKINFAKSTHYYDYNNEISKIIVSVSDLADIRPDYIDISYAIKKQFNVYQLLI